MALCLTCIICYMYQACFAQAGLAQAPIRAALKRDTFLASAGATSTDSDGPVAVGGVSLLSSVLTVGGRPTFSTTGLLDVVGLGNLLPNLGASCGFA